MKLLITFIGIIAISSVYGKTWDRCSLAREMLKLGASKSDLPKWMCIAEHESHFRAEAVSPKNKDGSRDYGIFQINNRWWCKPTDGGKSANGCKLSCNDLVDNVPNSVKCALTVKKEQGWKAWSTLKFCQGSLPSVDSCF